MGWSFIRKNWTRQPQGTITWPDWQHPLLKNAIAILPASGAFGFTRQGLVPTSGNFLLESNPYSRGRAVYHTQFSGALFLPIPSFSLPATVVTLYSRYDNNNQGSFCSLVTAANSNYSLSLLYDAYSNNCKAQDYDAGTFSNSSAAGNTTQTQLNMGAGIFTSNASRTGYSNGVLGTTNTDTRTVKTLNGLQLGRYGNNYIASSALVIVYSVAKTKEELDVLYQALKANPWQIFRPENLPVYFGAGGGTAEKAGVESFTLSLTEAQGSSLASTLSDALTPAVTDVSSLAALVAVVDSLAPAIIDVPGLLVAFASSDNVNPVLTEGQELRVSSVSSEIFTISLTEALVSLLSSALLEALNVSITDTSSVAQGITPVSVIDTFTLSLTNEQTSIVYSAILEALTITLGETAGSLLYSSITDVSTVVLSDSVSLLLCTLSSSDALVISLTGIATAGEVEESVKTVSDILGLSLTALGSVRIITRWTPDNPVAGIWIASSGVPPAGWTPDERES